MSRPARLLPNPKNWRTPSEGPGKRPSAGSSAEIGYADALLARETPEGLSSSTGTSAPRRRRTPIVPVLVLDVTEAEADKLLLTPRPARCDGRRGRRCAEGPPRAGRDRQRRRPEDARRPGQGVRRSARPEAPRRSRARSSTRPRSSGRSGASSPGSSGRSASTASSAATPRTPPTSRGS